MTISLTKLAISGLKKGDGDYDFSHPITIITGENGSGKTTILQAIHLLLRGRTPKSIGHAAAGKDIMALARGNKITICGTWKDESDHVVQVTRVWRKSKTSVKEEITQTIDPSISGTSVQQGLLNLYFGNIPEIWNPGAFFDLSSNKMRARLLTSISSRPIRAVLPGLAKILGDELPVWANPSSMEMTVETYLQSVIKEADHRIREAQATTRSCNAQLDEEPAFVKYRKESEVKADLEKLTTQRRDFIRIQTASSELRFLEGKKQALVEQLSEIDLDVEGAKAQVEELRERKTLTLEEIEAKYQEVANEYKIIGAQAEIQEQREDLKEMADISSKEERELKDTKEKLKKAEQHLLSSAKKPFEEAIASVVGKSCSIDLKNGGCVIRVDGVDVSALSDGETLSLVPGIIAGLSRASEAKWLPLPLDRFEAISKGRRPAFIQAVRKLIEVGALSQAIIAGCPDERCSSESWGSGVAEWNTDI